MATGFTDIIAPAMLLIDDIRWRDDLAVNPAAFYHQKSEWVVLALASLNRPPELGEYLTRTMAEPSFAEEYWTSDTASMSNPTTVVNADERIDGAAFLMALLAAIPAV